MEWQTFLKKWRKKHPKVSYRDAQKKASKEYQKLKSRRKTSPSKKMNYRFATNREFNEQIARDRELVGRMRREVEERNREYGPRNLKKGFGIRKPIVDTSNKENFSFLNFNKKSRDPRVFIKYDFEFIDENSDGRITQEEYSRQIRKYFNGNRDELEDKFNDFDTNSDGFIDEPEFENSGISENLRQDPTPHDPRTKYDDMKNLFFDGDQVCFKGMCKPTGQGRNKLSYLYRMIRYLVEVQGIVTYINLDLPGPSQEYNEEEIFNYVCRNPEICSYHWIPIEDFTAAAPDELARFVELIEENFARKRDTVVHCSSGMGRTGFMVLSYLISTNPKQNYLTEIIYLLSSAIKMKNFIDTEEEYKQYHIKSPATFKQKMEAYKKGIKIPYEKTVGNFKGNFNLQNVMRLEIFKLLEERYSFEAAEENFLDPIRLEDFTDFEKYINLLAQRMFNLAIFLTEYIRYEPVEYREFSSLLESLGYEEAEIVELFQLIEDTGFIIN